MIVAKRNPEYVAFLDTFSKGDPELAARLEALADRKENDPDFPALLEDAAKHQPDPKWATARAVDGPGFVTWLEEQDKRGAEVEQERSFWRWKKGGEATFGAVDRLAVRLGLHLKDVPDRLWLEKKGTK